MSLAHADPADPMRAAAIALAGMVERRDFAFSADGHRCAWVAGDRIVWSDRPAGAAGTGGRELRAGSVAPGGPLPPGTHLEMVSDDLIGVCRSTESGVELLAVDVGTGTTRTIASFMTPRSCLLPRVPTMRTSVASKQWLAVTRFDGTCTLYRFGWDTGTVAETGRLPMAVTGGVWLVAGRRLALNLTPDGGRASVYAIDVEAGRFNLLFEASPGSEDRIVLFDEASGLAVLTTDAFAYPAVGVTHLGGEGPGDGVRFFPALPDGDEAGTPCALVMVEGRPLIVLRHESGIFARLRLADPQTMTVSEPLAIPDGEVGAPVAACGTTLRFPFSAPDQPWRAAAFDLGGMRFTDDEDVAGDRAEPFRPGRAVTFPGPAGPMPALVLEPDPALDRGDLAVVALHGGPIARTGAEWKAELQLFARLGLPTVALDYPGSTGWGQAHMRSLFGRAGHVDVAAVSAVIDALGAGGRRVVLYGESYGAFLALLAGAARPCAGIIALAPFASFSSLRGSGSPEVREVLELLDGGNSDETGRNAVEACRIIRNRVLIVHGTADRTIPVDESRALAATLRERRGAGEDGVTFVELENQGHELSGPVALARCYLEIADFVGGLQ